MKKTLTFFLLLTLYLTPKAQYVTLPDGEFKDFLRYTYPGCFNQNQEFDTSCSETLNVDSLELDLYSGTLEGLQYFKQLTTLYISGGPYLQPYPLPSSLKNLAISGVNFQYPAFPLGLKKLNLYGCTSNYEFSIPASVDSLTFMSSENIWLSLPVGLIYLDLRNTKLRGFPALPNSLKYLNLSNNSFSNNTAPLVLGNLPTDLTYLNIDRRAVSFTSVPSRLKTLSCVQSNLEVLPALPASLTYLDCSRNLLAYLPALPDSLIELNISNNIIRTCPPLPSIQLETFICGSTQLAALPVLPGTLKTLITTGSFYLETLPTLPQSLTKLICDNNSLTALPSLPQNLRWLDCNKNSITTIPPLPDSLYFFNCSNNFLGSLPSLPLQLTDLNCSYNLLSAMPDLPVNLATLNCRHNQIQNIGALPGQLIALDCGNNQLSALIPMPPSLQRLMCDSNRLAALPTLHDGLLSIGCQNNQLTALPQLPATLRTLNCQSNLLSTIPALPDTLQTLNCSFNQLVSLPALPENLYSLYCQRNRIEQISSLPRALSRLDCSYNNLACLPKLLNAYGEYYNISGNHINCLPNNPQRLVINTDTISNRNINLPLCNPTNNLNRCNTGRWITGVVYFDMNANGVHDIGEPFKKNCKISLSSNSFTFTNDDGYYELQAEDEGEITITAAPPNYFDVLPASQTLLIQSQDTVNTINFSLRANASIDSPAISLTPLTARARPGFPFAVKVSYENAGSITSSPVVVLDYDETKLDYDSTSNPLTTNNGSALTLAVPGFLPAYNSSFIAYFHVKTTAPLMDSLLTRASISNSNTSNQSTFNTVITGSFDPNDKRGTPVLTPTQVANGEYIDYTIRFQNTGTDTAFTVVISDTLSSDLQASTLQMIAASHSCKTTVKDNIVFFEFLNILLPDSNVNEPLSHGFVRFKIKPRSNIAVNSNINNKAAIYFDYNVPIITNTATTAIRNPLVPVPLHLISFTAVRSTPTTASLEWNTANEINTGKFTIQQSTDGRSFADCATEPARSGQYNFYRRSVSIPNESIYLRLKMLDIDGQFSYSPVVLLRKQGSKAPFTILNNPVKTTLNIEVGDAELYNTTARIINAQGMVVQSFLLRESIQRINLERLPAGTYTLQTLKGSELMILTQ